MIDSDELEVFVILAEELHFTRTAELLRLPQSRVSRLVASLERRVGGTLFERTSRRVTLTPLGKQLLDRVGPAYAELEAALGEARDRARNVDGELRIGLFPSSGGPALTRLLEGFGSRYPGCDVTLLDTTSDLYGLLRRDEADVLIAWLVASEPDLTRGPVIAYRDRVLVVGLGHRLAERESISFEELADEQVHGGRPDYPAAVFDAIVPPVTPSGRVIRRTHPWRSWEDIIRLTALGQIVHPSATGVPLFQRADLREIPIPDMPPLPLGLIWVTTRENARIRALASVAREIGPRPAQQQPRGRASALGSPARSDASEIG